MFAQGGADFESNPHLAVGHKGYIESDAVWQTGVAVPHGGFFLGKKGTCGCSGVDAGDDEDDGSLLQKLRWGGGGGVFFFFWV